MHISEQIGHLSDQTGHLPAKSNILKPEKASGIRSSVGGQQANRYDSIVGFFNDGGAAFISFCGSVATESILI